MPSPRRSPFALFAPPLAVLALACGGGAPAERPDERRAPPVEAVVARAGALPEVIRLEGTVRAADQVEVRAEIAAPVVEVRVASGQAVRRGELLVRLQDDTLAEQTRQAEAAVRLAEATATAARARVDEVAARATRSRALAAQGLTSALETETLDAQLAAARASAEEALARVDAARATLEERRAALARADVRSPVDGRVGQVRIERGMRLEPGDLLFVVGDLDRLEVELPLSEAQLARAAVGQRVEILARAGDGEPIAARVARISPFLAPGSFSTVAEVELDDSGRRLAPGAFVAADLFVGESARATLLPTNALHEDPASGAFAVYVVADGAALAATEGLGERTFEVELRPVEPLAEGRGVVAVDGVAEGEWVVTVGQHLLAADGRGVARVRPTTWERVAELQSLQREDVLERFLAKQRRLAREAGSAPIPREASAGGGEGR